MMKYEEYTLNESFDFGTQTEIGRVFIEKDGEDENLSGETWRLILNINPIWNKYENNQIKLDEFNKAYFKFLTDNKTKILEYIEDKEKFENSIKKLNEVTDEDGSESAWNSLYDIFDKNEIQLKV